MTNTRALKLSIVAATNFVRGSKIRTASLTNQRVNSLYVATINEI